MLSVVPICVPPESHVAGASTLQRKNFSVPVQLLAPTTLRTAASVTDTEPVPIERPPPGMSAPAPVFGVVVRPDWQLPKLPSTKSLSVAVSDCEDRVSASTLAKHSLPSPRSDRLMPASKNSPRRNVLKPLLSVNGHGAKVPSVWLTIPQKASPGEADRQLAASEVASSSRFPFTEVFH